jgi:hypothetical protein
MNSLTAQQVIAELVVFGILALIELKFGATDSK